MQNNNNPAAPLLGGNPRNFHIFPLIPREIPVFNFQRLFFFILKRDKRFFNILKNPGMHINDPRYYKAMAFVEGFFKGVYTITQVIWPLLFLGMFIYDATKYANPENRFLAQIEDLIFGFPQNYSRSHVALLANFFGGDLPERFNYWYWTFFYGSLPIAGFVNGIRYLFFKLDETYSQKFGNIDQFYFNPFKAVPNYLKAHYEISKIGFALRWDYEITQKMRQIGNIGQQLPNPQEVEERLLDLCAASAHAIFPLNLFAISELSDIADRYRTEPFLIRNSIHTDVLQVLEHNADWRRLFSTRFYATIYTNYKLWTIGESKYKGPSIAFSMLLTPFLLFAQWHLWRLFITKLNDVRLNNTAEKECLQKGFYWQYVAETGYEECLACDWHFVDYKNAQTTQGCLNKLFSMDRPPAVYANGSFFQALSNQTMITALDLSQQSWTSWLNDDWNQFVKQLNSLNLNLDTFNVSAQFKNGFPVDYQKIMALSDFIKAHPANHYDFRHLNIGPDAFGLISIALNGTQINSLILNDIALQDAGLNSISAILPWTKISNLDIYGNLISSFGLQNFLNAEPNKTISFLNVGGNQLTPMGFQLLADQIPRGIQKLILNDMDFTGTNATAFATSLSKSTTLSFISMSNCQLTNQAIRQLTPTFFTQFKEVDWSYNNIDDYGIILIEDQFTNTTTILNLKLAGNSIGNIGVMTLSTCISNSTLTHLTISANSFDATSFMNATTGFLNSKLISLDVGYNNLGEQAPIYFFQQLRNKTHSLKELMLDNVGLSQTGATSIFNDLPESGIVHLSLNSNSIGAACGQPLSAALQNPNNALEFLSVTANAIETKDFLQIIPSLKYSRLKTLIADRNPINGTFSLLLAESLVTDFPKKDSIAFVKDPVDVSRALMRANATTSLKYLSLQNCQLATEGVRALCHIEIPANLTIAIQNNHFSQSEVGVLGCPTAEFIQTSNATRLVPSIFLLRGISIAYSSIKWAFWLELPIQLLRRFEHYPGINILRTMLQILPILIPILRDPALVIPFFILMNLLIENTAKEFGMNKKNIQYLSKVTQFLGLYAYANLSHDAKFLEFTFFYGITELASTQAKSVSKMISTSNFFKPVTLETQRESTMQIKNQ